MALPAEPRQKMINLMYLVLTAMLALNVSAEILNAFKTVDNSLTETNSTINNSTETIVASLDEKRSDPTTAAKAQIWFPKAQRAQQLTAELNTYINSLRSQILTAAGFDPKKNGDSTFKEDNQDVATRLMVTEGKGKELRARLEKYKADMLDIDPSPAMKSQIEADLRQINLETPRSKNTSNPSWETAYFHMVPTVAALTMLSKFQNDVKTAENRVVSLFHEQVGKVAVRFDTYAAIVGQSSSYVMPGQEIEITAGVGAFSKAARPTVTINGSGAALGEDGAARATFTAGGVGSHSVPVTITYTDQEGNPQRITKNVEYTVGQSATAISLTKMNVLYIGVDNPVSIAASGGAEKLDPRISQGSLTKTGPGQYIARVSSVNDNTTIAVNVDGKLVGQQVFRVRTIPDPVATVGGYASGENIPANAFKAQGGVGAGIKDFPFELKYSVTSFTLTADTEDGDIIEVPCTGNTWNTQARNVINRVKPNQLITIDAIRAVGPDGRTRRLPSLVYYIK